MTPDRSYYREGARDESGARIINGMKIFFLQRFVITTTYSTPTLFRDFFFVCVHSSVDIFSYVSILLLIGYLLWCSGSTA